MTVQELIKQLQSFPPELEVVIQKDGEGNSFSPLHGANDHCVYVPETTWFGEAIDTRWAADEACMSEAEWEEFKTRPRAVILEPVN